MYFLPFLHHAYSITICHLALNWCLFSFTVLWPNIIDASSRLNFTLNSKIKRRDLSIIILHCFVVQIELYSSIASLKPNQFRWFFVSVPFKLGEDNNKRSSDRIVRPFSPLREAWLHSCYNSSLSYILKFQKQLRLQL